MTEQYSQQPVGYANQTKDSGLAIVSLVFGIASYVFLYGIGGIVAIICGHLAKKEINNSNGMIKGSGFATAGLVLGYVNLGICVLVLAVFIIIGVIAAKSYSY